MKKYSFRIMILLTVTFSIWFSSCSNKHIDSSVSQRIVPEKQLLFRYYDNKSRIRYDFRNDDSALYVILETDNRSSQMRIQRNGVIFYLSHSSKKDEGQFVQYPVPSAEERIPVQREGNQVPGENNTGNRKQYQPMQNRNSFALWNNNGAEQTFRSGIDHNGFEFNISYSDDHFMHYEARILLKRLDITEKDRLTTIGIRIDPLKNAVNRTGNNGMRANEQGSRGGGSYGGGMSGRGMQGGMRGGGRSGGGRMRTNGEGTYTPATEGENDKINWWYKIKLG